MSDKVKIAIDAMGGENSPKKIIEAINLSLKKSKENFFYLGNGRFTEEKKDETDLDKVFPDESFSLKLKQYHNKTINDIITLIFMKLYIIS